MRPAELQEVGSVEEVEPNASNGECDEVPIDLGIIHNIFLIYNIIYIHASPLPAAL